jgi:hypothetical protein
MDKSKKNEPYNAEALKKKLEAIIAHSKAENEALRKILSGLEKNKDIINDKKNTIKSQREK